MLNASYRFIRQQVGPTGDISQLKQVDLSGQWPFLDNWSSIGRWNYSLVDSKTLEGVVGLEYNGGCWAFRIVGQRLTTTTQQASTSVFVQFELNGLARLGTNPIDVLKRSVPRLSDCHRPGAAACRRHGQGLFSGVLEGHRMAFRNLFKAAIVLASAVGARRNRAHRRRIASSTSIAWSPSSTTRR